MKPIISPWLIYFASRVDSLKNFAVIILACCIIAICIAFIEGDIEYGSVLTHKSFMKKMRNSIYYQCNCFSYYTKYRNSLYNGSSK